VIDFVISSLSTTWFCSLYLITFATFLGGGVLVYGSLFVCHFKTI